jgi:hypothetical protein
MMARKKGTKVTGHVRKMASGKPVKVGTYRRKKRKKAKGKLTARKLNIIYDFPGKKKDKKYEVTYYTDKNGQLVAKRKYKRIK